MKMYLFNVILYCIYSSIVNFGKDMFRPLTFKCIITFKLQITIQPCPCYKLEAKKAGLGFDYSLLLVKNTESLWFSRFSFTIIF